MAESTLVENGAEAAPVEAAADAPPAPPAEKLKRLPKPDDTEYNAKFDKLNTEIQSKRARVAEIKQVLDDFHERRKGGSSSESTALRNKVNDEKARFTGVLVRPSPIPCAWLLPAVSLYFSGRLRRLSDGAAAAPAGGAAAIRNLYSRHAPVQPGRAWRQRRVGNRQPPPIPSPISPTPHLPGPRPAIAAGRAGVAGRSRGARAPVGAATAGSCKAARSLPRAAPGVVPAESPVSVYD